MGYIRRFTDKDGYEYIAITDAARLLGRHPTTLYAWARSGKVKHIRLGLGGGKSPSYYLRVDSLREHVGPAADLLER